MVGEQGRFGRQERDQARALGAGGGAGAGGEARGADFD